MPKLADLQGTSNIYERVASKIRTAKDVHKTMSQVSKGYLKQYEGCKDVTCKQVKDLQGQCAAFLLDLIDKKKRLTPELRESLERYCLG